MFPDNSHQETAEKIASYFNSISQEYEPLSCSEIPMTFHRQLPLLTCGEVAKTLRECKKSSSTVPGDINSALYAKFSEQLSVPITEIYNQVLRDKVWPLKWKTEYVTVIPKGVGSPQEPSECRNISCTNFLSKVLERIVLNLAREEVKPRLNQFGGEPGASTTHLLMSVLDYTIDSLEDNRSAVVLSAVDFSKAFNHLEHAACLRTFAAKGASTEIVQLLAAFLSGRVMTVKVEKDWSTIRPVNAGAPQGSVLGCYLFNVGVDSLEEGVCFQHDQGSSITREHLNRTDDFPASSTPARVGTNQQQIDISPLHNSSQNEFQVDFLPRIANIPPWLRAANEKKWKERPLLSVKFVDDGINAAAINMKEVPMMKEGNLFTKEAQPERTQRLLEHIRLKAKELGLRVNEKKTNLICISAAKSFQANFKIAFGGQTVTGADRIKILGVTVDRDCSFRTHVNNVAKKLRKKTWALGKLKKKGMSTEHLVQAYSSLIRPCAEYASPAWHPLININQSEHIERQQSQALKNIFGVGMSAKKM